MRKLLSHFQRVFVVVFGDVGRIVCPALSSSSGARGLAAKLAQRGDLGVDLVELGRDSCGP
jgi:hypothetical protein